MSFLRLLCATLPCLLACGGEAESAPRAGNGDAPVSPGAPLPFDSGPNVDQPALSAPQQPPAPGVISSQRSARCVALPELAPLPPALSYDEGCAVPSLERLPDLVSTPADDARALLVGRWRLCGEVAYYGGAQHAGIEFGSNGRDQLLWQVGSSLRPLNGGPQGVYYVLPSGQFMQRGELSFGGYSANVRFDSTGSVMQLEDSAESNPPLRYVRVAANPDSAAANVFSTSAGQCSLVGVWDTAQPSENPPAAFAFNERGEWFGGEWGSDLCAAHSMYGTYNLEARGGPVQDNFDLPPSTEFELVTNVGAGLCSFWFNAGFIPTFSQDCNRVHLEPSWDNCTGGRGYLGSPGDDLIRRVP